MNWEVCLALSVGSAGDYNYIKPSKISDMDALEMYSGGVICPCIEGTFCCCLLFLCNLRWSHHI